jgi:hypothetical protein
MKKVLMVMLILALVSAASALTITYQWRDAGLNPITQIDPGYAGTFYCYVIASGSSGTDSWQYGLYTSDGTNGGGLFDVDGGTAYPAAGNKHVANYYPSYDGVDFTAGMLGTIPPLQVDGDWFRAACSLNAGVANGDVLTIDVEDYNNQYNVVGSTTLDVVSPIPEPMTLALLGLGGLFLRRRGKNR